MFPTARSAPTTSAEKSASICRATRRLSFVARSTPASTRQAAKLSAMRCTSRRRSTACVSKGSSSCSRFGRTRCARKGRTAKSTMCSTDRAEAPGRCRHCRFGKVTRRLVGLPAALAQIAAHGVAAAAQLAADALGAPAQRRQLEHRLHVFRRLHRLPPFDPLGPGSLLDHLLHFDLLPRRGSIPRVVRGSVCRVA
jgi:hypothetical protein